MSDVPATVPAAEALRRLVEGNERFVRDEPSAHGLATAARRRALAAGQTPFAIILSCSDSRVPAELVFDCSLGDLFVVRVAGNVVAPSLVGSIEFAAASFGTALAVVMGHSRCGAVAATLDVSAGRAPESPNLRDIVDRIRPAVSGIDPRAPDALARATTANVRRSVGALRASAVLSARIAAGALTIVGAEYDLESGRVRLVESNPAYGEAPLEYGV